LRCVAVVAVCYSVLRESCIILVTG